MIFCSFEKIEYFTVGKVKRFHVNKYLKKLTIIVNNDKRQLYTINPREIPAIGI